MVWVLVLVQSIMESPPADGGCGIDIENLVANKVSQEQPDPCPAGSLL